MNMQRHLPGRTAEGVRQVMRPCRVCAEAQVAQLCHTWTQQKRMTDCSTTEENDLQRGSAARQAAVRHR